MKRILATLAFIVALAGGSVLMAGSAQKAGSPACCDPCCEKHESAASSCAKTGEQVASASAPSCKTE